MFFILSKTLDILLLPYTWIIILAFCSILLKDRKKKKLAGIFTLLLLVVMGNALLVNALLRQWEMPPQPLSKVPDASTAIILTGVTKLNKLPYDRVYFARGADRVTQALSLYRKGKIKRFIITGGSGKLIGEGRDEAFELKKFLADCSIPDSLIFLEREARNTHENAVLTKQLIERENIQGPYILITSAFHMKRAWACFEKEKINCFPFPVDYYSADEIDNPMEYIVPEVSQLNNLTLLIREVCGYWIYKWSGYL